INSPQVNGQVLLGKSHLNAAPLIIGCQTRRIKLVIVRRPGNIASMAVKARAAAIQPASGLRAGEPQTAGNVNQPRANWERLAVGGLRALDQRPPAAANGALGVIRCDSPPVALEEDDEIGPETSAPQEQPTPKIGPYGAEYSCTLVKGKQGLGFAIMERNFNDELGIYVKHITDGGPAGGRWHPADRGSPPAGQRVRAGEATYDEALDRLRSMTGVVRITVGRKIDPATAAAAAAAAAAAQRGGSDSEEGGSIGHDEERRNR
uniref:PDZ domain-containing protein n=1 Tax=Macrostomum lignano TaxID=282301 RepID=A0A1I8ICK5_9PLAT